LLYRLPVEVLIAKRLDAGYNWGQYVEAIKPNVVCNFEIILDIFYLREKEALCKAI
jgi:hypothetical protein